jgi:AcrR family transcriptional regulator
MTADGLEVADQAVSEALAPTDGHPLHKTGSTTVRRTQGQRLPRRLGQIPGGRHGLAPETVAELQRARILAAMTAAVAERGYHETSVADVISRAGVSRKTFYERFAGKDECFAAAYGEEMDRLLAVTLSAFGEEGPWVVRVRDALTALCAALATNPTAARVCLVEALGAGPATAERRQRELERLLPIFEAAPADAVRGLPFRESLSLGRLRDLTEMLHQEIAAGAGRELPRMVPQLTYMMVLPFLGPERAARELGGERRLRPAS